MTPPTAGPPHTRKQRATISVLEPTPAPAISPARAGDPEGTGRPQARPELRSCAICDEDPGLKGLAYRIVLRCSHSDA